jgi:hypothetical protein
MLQLSHQKWSSHTKRRFSSFPHHTQRQVDIVITKDNFQTMANIIIADPICIDLVQCASMMHAMTFTTQYKV